MSIAIESPLQFSGTQTQALPRGPRINLGCGPVIADGWMNVDGSLRAWLVSHAWPLDRLLVRLHILPETAFNPQVLYHNLKKPLPWPSHSVAAIYAGEVWEHLEYEEACRLTGECHRVLMTGGVLRLCVPDGVAFWQRYLEIFEEERVRERASQNAHRLRTHVQMYYDDICTKATSLKSFSHYHKWQYDEIQLIDIMERSGLRDVSRQKFAVSRIGDIARLERSNFLIVEGVKR